MVKNTYKITKLLKRGFNLDKQLQKETKNGSLSIKWVQYG
jgi:hypothetical protein